MANEIRGLPIDMKQVCLTCSRPGAINGAHCLECTVTRIKSGFAHATEHLPDFWAVDEDIVRTANNLIDEHVWEVATAKICFIFRKKHNKVNGRMILGTCHKEPGKQKLLHGFDYVVTLAFDVWCMLDERQREALLLHELCHIQKDGEEDAVWKTAPHEVEEFIKVVKVYGLWMPNLEDLAKAIDRSGDGPKQMRIGQTFGDIGATEPQAQVLQ